MAMELNRAVPVASQAPEPLSQKQLGSAASSCTDKWEESPESGHFPSLPLPNGLKQTTATKLEFLLDRFFFKKKVFP